MKIVRLNPHHQVFFFSQGDPGLGRCGSLDSLHDVTPSERPASHFSDEGNIIYLELTILKRKIQLCTERYFSRNTGVSFKSETKKYSSLTNTWQRRKPFNLSLKCINIFSCKLSLLVLTKYLWNVPILFEWRSYSILTLFWKLLGKVDLVPDRIVVFVVIYIFNVTYF